MSNNTTATHQAFSFVTDEAKNAPFATLFSDMQALSSGLQLCLELIEKSNADRDCGCDDFPPFLDPYDTGRMIRLAVATSGILAGMVDEQLVEINRNAKANSKGDVHGS